MILGDRDLRYYIKTGRIYIEPYDEEIVRENGIDLRLSNEIAKLKPSSIPVDTRDRDLDPGSYYEIIRGDSFIIMPNERVLLNTMEFIKLPDDIMAFVNLRSTYARLGILAPPTIVDAGFEGNITIEVVGGSFPIKLHSGDRFAHLIFARLLTPVEKPYIGDYQGQRGVRLPKMFRMP
ncbi:MAG: dCTP deaminase [Fervidicoccaceae archaeon]